MNLMKAWPLTWLLTTSFACAAPEIEEIQTPYGVLEAAEIPATNSYALTFGGHQIGKLEADAVSLQRVSAPANGPAYIIVSKSISGLNCRQEFVLVKIGSPTSATVSDSFGNYMELAGAEPLADGVRVTLKGAVKKETEQWTWQNGVLSRMQAGTDLLHYVNHKYGYEIDYPPSFVGHGEADAGDGQIFTVPGNDARLTVSGLYCGDDVYSPARLINDYKQSEREGKLVLTYSRQTKTFGVVSGTRGGRIFYKKLLTNGEQCAQFTLEYDSAAKARYDPLTGRIASSLKLLQD